MEDINFDNVSTRVFETIDEGDFNRFELLFGSKYDSKFRHLNLDHLIKDWITHKYQGGNASSSSSNARGFSLLQYAAYRGQSDVFKFLLERLPTREDKINHFKQKSTLMQDLGTTLVRGWLMQDSKVTTPALREIMKTMLDVDRACFENCLVFLARTAKTSGMDEYKAMQIVLEQAEIQTSKPMKWGIECQAESVKFDKKYFINR